MKTLFFILEKDTGILVGAYPTLELLEFELTLSILQHKFKSNMLKVQKKDNIPDHVYDHLMKIFKRKDIWN